MAAEDEGRTEAPSETRLQKKRKEGKVPKSAEVSSALILLLCVIFIMVTAKWLFNNLTSILRYYFLQTGKDQINVPLLRHFFLEYFLKSILPVFLIAILAGIIGNIIQTRGFVISLDPIKPNPERIIPRPGEWLKSRIFSRKGIFNIAKALLKVVIIALTGYLVIKKDIFILIQVINNGDIAGALQKIGSMAAQLLIIVAVFFLIISVIDFFVERFNFLEEMKMTKQEVKEEYKEEEGDPEVKNRLNQMQMEMLRRNIPKAVAESDVVIANPTHYAVALKYDKTVAEAPFLKAKGEDGVAQTIKRIARENNIPIVENKPVARELYTNTEIGAIIPDIYIRTIVEIYTQLDKFKNYNK